jgi:hypothetical protein
MVERIIEHPHVNDANNMRQVFIWDNIHVRNLIHVGQHHDGGRVHTLQPPRDAFPLVLFAEPWVRPLGSLLGRHDDVLNLRQPLGESLLVILKEELLWPSRMVHLRLDEYETVNTPVENSQTELEDVQFVIEHERIDEHLI